MDATEWRKTDMNSTEVVKEWSIVPSQCHAVRSFPDTWLISWCDKLRVTIKWRLQWSSWHSCKTKVSFPVLHSNLIHVNSTLTLYCSGDYVTPSLSFDVFWWLDVRRQTLYTGRGKALCKHCIRRTVFYSQTINCRVCCLDWTTYNCFPLLNCWSSLGQLRQDALTSVQSSITWCIVFLAAWK